MTTISDHPRGTARLALAGLAGALALGLTACGASGSGAAAGSAPATAGSAASSPAASTSAPAAVKPATSVADLSARILAATRAKGTAHLSSTSGAASGVKSTGVERLRSSGGVDLSMTTALPTGTSMTMVIVDGALYLNPGEAYQGKHWVRVRPGGSDPLSKALGPLLAQLNSGLDVSSQVPSSKDAKITDTTRTETGGVPVTKYTVVSSVAALLAQFDKFSPSPEVRKALHQQFAGAHAESTLWIDDAGLPQRVDSRVVGAAAGAAASGAGSSTITYSHWGEPVKITAPPSGDVVDLGA